MEYRITITNSYHRQKPQYEYAKALNSKTIIKNNFGKHIAIKNLFTNITTSEKKEIRCLNAICKLISDESLDYDEIAIDQTLRNVIGKYFKNTLNELVKIENIKESPWCRLRNHINKGQYLYSRVFMASLLDMEKPYVRISEDSLNILAGLDGRRIWIENNVNDITNVLDNKSREEFKTFKIDNYYDLIIYIIKFWYSSFSNYILFNIYHYYYDIPRKIVMCI